MPKLSAGILLYRFVSGKPEVFLVHPGGPFWVRKDSGVWSVPKGEYSEGEDPLEAARREFYEETGQKAEGNFFRLNDCRLKSGKLIRAWAAEGNADEKNIKSNTFEMEWPPGSGKKQSFPEVDKAGWFGIEKALTKIHPAQAPFIEELAQRIDNL